MTSAENWVLMLTHNCYVLTLRAMRSVLKQDIPVRLLILDDASDDGTPQMLSAMNEKDERVETCFFRPSIGVTALWNFGLKHLFNEGAGQVLVINNDVKLAPNFYRELLRVEGGLVSGISTNDRAELGREWTGNTSPHPDFSSFVLRKWAWDKLGPFNEKMRFYAQDNSYHVEAFRKGVPFVNAGVPFYHERSSTLKNAPPAEHERMCKQADADRAVFKAIYGCEPWEPAYAELFKASPPPDCLPPPVALPEH